MHRQHNLFFDRDDLLWGQLTAAAINPYRGDGEPPVTAQECMPYHDPFAEEITAEELVKRLGFGGGRFSTSAGSEKGVASS